MKKKILTVMLAGVMAAGMSAGSVQAQQQRMQVVICMYLLQQALQMQWMRSRKILMKSIRMLIFFSMQTVQVHYRHRLKKVPDVISSSAATKQMDALVDEELAKKSLW